MRTILFHVPTEIFGWPLFGWGIILAIWSAVCAVTLLWTVKRQGWNRETLSYLPVMLLVAAVIGLVMPRLQQSLAGLPVRGYGVMVLAGIVAGIALAARRAAQRGIDPEHIYSLGFWVIACGVIGARAYYVVLKWDEFARPTLQETILAILNIPEGGLVVYGSLFGAAAAFLFYVRRQHLPLLTLADIVAPSLLIGLALGRVGCFLNGCCFGDVCDPSSLSVQFPFQSPPYRRQVAEGRIYLHGIKLVPDAANRPMIAAVEPGSLAEAQGLRPGELVKQVQGQPVDSVEQAFHILVDKLGADTEVSILTAGASEPKHWTLSLAREKSLPMYPAQLYATFGALLVALLLLAYEPFRRRDGEVAALMLMVYPVLRFAEEMLRRDEPTVGGLKIAQWISLALLMAGIALMAGLRRTDTGTNAGNFGTMAG